MFYKGIPKRIMCIGVVGRVGCPLNVKSVNFKR